MDEQPRTWVVPTAFRPLVVLGFFGGFSAFMLWSRVQATPGLFWAFAVSSVGFAVWFGWLFLRMKREGRDLTIEFRPRLPHWIQMLVHGSIFLYWGLHWDNVFPHLPLVVAQVFFAYMLELGLAWTQYRNFRLGFGPVPIVGSTNLFLWFKDPFFGAQFGMLLVSYLARQFLRWERDGQKTHIFNPSAIGLSVAATVVIAGGWVHHTWGPEISISLGYGQFSFEQIFMAGALVMVFFDVALMTMSAAITAVLIGWIYFQVTGVWFFVDTAIPIAVFLGMNLLVTDPVTSPRSAGGKVLFGALYTAGVMVLYVVLRGMERPPSGDDPGLTAAFFDKLLFVPVLNLGAVFIDRIGRKIPLEKLTGALEGYGRRAAYLGVWAVAFFLIRPQLIAHPGADPEFWRAACEDNKPWACDNVRRVLLGPCEKGSGEACHNLGVIFEFGEGVTEDVEVAAGYYNQACTLGAAESCSHLGGLLMTKSERSDRAIEARALFDKACAGGSGTGCVRLGVLKMHNASGGPATKAGLAEARVAFRKACAAKDAQGCHLLGGQLLMGKGGPANVEEATTHFREACALKFQPGCDQLERMGKR